MIYLIIFATSFILMIFLISFQAYRLHKYPALQKSEEWYSIDLVTLKNETHHRLRSQTRPLMRGFLYRSLEWYQNTVRVIRTMIRKAIGNLLHHYDETNDPQPPRQSSAFLNQVREHKDSLADQKLHDDEPREN